MNLVAARRPFGRLLRLGALAAIAATLQVQDVNAQAGRVPSPEEHLGYALGERFTDHAGVREYGRMLAAVSPSVEYRPYGTTVEGRELLQLVIGTPAHLSRLDEILKLNRELTLEGTTEARARQIAASIPAVVYFSYGVHGNESSSSEAALWTAYDLVTNAPPVEGVLDSLILVMDPVTNPDGRDRYVQWYRSVVGARPNADPQTREHREPWPGGRFNHYLFDLNRDWAWMTQPETRARLRTWWEWNPQVHVDFHEMSPNSTYFFFPAAAPVNPIYSEHILEWGIRFGRENARTFDEQGWPYFTRESYDMLYPGYGDSWPSLLGTVGMTYEQAGGGSAGMAFARTDGDTLTLRHRATRHRAAGNATLRTIAAGKSRLLLDFAEAHRTAGEGYPDILLVPGSEPSRLDALVDHLLAQNIEVERAESGFRVSAQAYPGFENRRDFPTGTVRVRARQPRGRLALTLLQPETELRGAFSYDITAWSLPYAYGVEAHQAAARPPTGRWVGAISSPPVSPGVPDAGYGYLVPPGDRSAPGIVRYLSEGGTLRVVTKPSTFEGREWPAGTWFLPAFNQADVRERVERSGLGGLATPIATGLAERGVDLGSANTPVIRRPRLAVVAGEGIVATSFGAHWYHLEQQLGMAFDAILLTDLGRIDLSRYDVIVIPDMRGRLEEPARESLRDWVERGGRLVAVSGGAEAAAPVAGVELRQRAAGDDTDVLLILLETREERDRRMWNEEVPGAILEAHLDSGHPISWGAILDGGTDRLFVLHERGRVFEPRTGAEVVAYFGPQLQPTSGVISDRNLLRLEQGAWLLSRTMGSGRVILFADDPLFRLFWRSTKPLYLNAILLGGL